MASISMRQMLEAGVHFGHQTRFWNPRMAPFIFGERNRIHIINLERTLPLYNDAAGFVKGVVGDGGKLLFVGTKRSARDAIQAGAIGYLMKDVLKTELLSAIRAAADGKPTLHPEAQYRLMNQLTQPDEPSPLDALTDRERDVLRLIARGKSNKAIASTLFLSVGTVKGYVSAILAKLAVTDRTKAALIAVRHGLGEE